MNCGYMGWGTGLWWVIDMSHYLVESLELLQVKDTQTPLPKIGLEILDLSILFFSFYSIHLLIHFEFLIHFVEILLLSAAQMISYVEPTFHSELIESKNTFHFPPNDPNIFQLAENIHFHSFPYLFGGAVKATKINKWLTNPKNIVWIHEKGANKFWNWKSKIHWYHPIFWLANISYTFYWSIRKRGGPANFTFMFSELFCTIFTLSCYKSHLLVYVRGLWQSLSLLNPTQVAGNKVNHDFHRESISHLGKGWNCHPDWLEEDYFHLFYRSIANNLKYMVRNTAVWCPVTLHHGDFLERFSV